jgi:hypothetical protein
LANGVSPKIMNYQQNDIDLFKKGIDFSTLRLDQDEKNHSFFLLRNIGNFPQGQLIDHVEKIHVNKMTCDIQFIPHKFREKLLKIIENYTKGYCKLEGESWSAYEKISVYN